jgi:hypothetical protein
MHAQFSSKNLLACPITNSHLISKFLNSSTSILTNELLKFDNSVVHCTADGPTNVLVDLNGCLVLNRACHSSTRVWLMLSSLNACLIIARVSFPIFAQNLMHTHCSSVGSIMKSHQTRYMTQTKGCKESACPNGCVKFCTLTPKVC